MLVKMNCENGSSGYEIGTVTITVGSQTFQWSKLKQKPTRFFLYKLSTPVAQGDIIHLYDPYPPPRLRNQSSFIDTIKEMR